MLQKLLLSITILLSSLLGLHGQDCHSAKEIVIGDNGFALGQHVSELIDLTNASKEFGEFFPEGFDYLAIDNKTVWFKFKIETARGVRIELRQRDSAISQNAVGMTIYTGWNCLPNESRLEPRLIPINKFGEVSTNCLSKGEYLIQVCASHKANDTIWIEVTTEKPPLLYDFQETAHNFGVFNGNKSLIIETSCLSLEDSDEIHNDLPAEFKKTAWFTFETNKNHLMYGLSIGPANPNNAPANTYFAILFKGDVRNGVIEDVSDTIHYWFINNLTNTNRVLNTRNCLLEDETKYSILVYFNNSTQNNYRVEILQKNNITEKSANPPSLGSEFNMGMIIMNQTKTTEGRFGCESFIKNNICEPVNSQTPFEWNNRIYDLTAWRTFTISQEGEMRFALTIGNSCNSIINSQLLYVVYKGDIRTNCNLPVIDTSFNNSYKCLIPGTYSVQILGRSIANNLGSHNANVCNISNLGELFKLTISLNKGLTPILSKYSNPEFPNNIGDLSSIFDSDPSFTVDLDYFGERHPNDTLRINNYNSNSRIYREFYLSKKEALRFIREDFGNNLYENRGFRVIKGRLSQGMDSSSIANNTILHFGNTNNNLVVGTQCEKVDTGWYSILAFSEYNERCLGEIDKHKYNLFSINRIASSCSNIPNQTPSGAVSFNNTSNSVLSVANSPNSGTEADFAKSYIGGNACLICDSTGNVFANQLYNSCKGSTDTLKMLSATFFYFRLDQKSDINFLDNEILVLYKGDFREDSLGLLDFNKRIHTCSDSINKFSNSYCGLDTGFYTLVRLITRKNTQNYLALWVDKHLIPKHDNAETAYHFPEMSPGLSFESPLDNISCLTGAHKEHPLVQDIPRKLLQYPMEQHVIQHNEYHTRNVWYTFTARGSGEIEVLISNLSRRKINNQNHIRVYESTSNPKVPYQNAYQNGLIDSSIAQGLIPVPLLDYSSSLRNRFFVKGSSCENDTTLKRYFIVIPYVPAYPDGTGPLLKQYFRVKVTMKPILEPKLPGDYCTAPVNFTTNNFGSFQSSDITVNCHSSGEGFGEDGTNLACLDPGIPIQTSWVKISVQNITKADLTFSITPSLAQSLNNQNLKFRLLYGDCKALTPGPCIAYSGSSFRLDCMPAGDYYIQVSTPLGSKGTFKVNVSVTESQFPECKPSSLFEPLANFNFSPPCNSSVVQFDNWSSAGEDITYFWDFGNGSTSTEKNPKITFSHNKDIDTFVIKLIVTNTMHQSKDSIAKSLRIYKEPFVSTLKVETDSFCSGFVELSLKNNYFPISEIKWSPSPFYSNDTQHIYRFATNPNQNLLINVRSSYYECISSDSVFFNKQELYSLSLDTFACFGEEIQIDITDKANQKGITEVGWFDQTNEFIITIADTGEFWMQLKKDGCVWYDTFRISSPVFSDNITPKYSFACSGSVVDLGINPELTNPIWSNGEITHKISTDKSGFYSVTANYLHCEMLDTFEVEIPDFSNVIPPNDTAKCNDEILNLFLNANQYEVEWFDGSSSTNIGVSDSGTYWVKISDRTCDTVFGFSVGEYPSTLELEADTALCDLVPIRLDAGMGRSFIWHPTNEIEQSIQVPDFGIFSVTKVNQYGCVEFDTFVLSKYCGPKLFVPNAFSPNSDGLNETFLPINENLTSFRMIILNRWGEQLFETKSMNIGWDGTFEGIKCQNGVYTYVIWYTMEDEGKLIDGITKGTVTLLR